MSSPGRPKGEYRMAQPEGAPTSGQHSVLEVWLDCDLGPACPVGTLAHDRGFILGETGWRLAPAFDVNPNIDKAEHALNIDDSDNRPSLDTVTSTAEFYGLTRARGKEVVEEVAAAVDGWQDAARRQRIAAADVELASGAFSAHSDYRKK